MRKLLITLIVLVAILVGVDFGLRWFATKKVGEAVATELQLAAAPDVAVSGFPFAVQAIKGEYETINIDAPDLTLGPVTGATADVTLNGVKIPLSEALAGNVNAMTASSAGLRISIPATNLAAAFGLSGLTITPAADGALTLSSTITVAGQSFPVTATLAAAVVDSTLELRADSMQGAGIEVPADILSAAVSTFNLDIPLTGVPFNIRAATVGVVGADLVLTGSVTDIVLSQLRR